MKQSLNGLPMENVPLQVASSIQQQVSYALSENRQLAYDVLVLDAEQRQSLATVRALGSRGLRVAALATSRETPTLSSRWCRQAFICEKDNGTEEYFLYLEQLLERIGLGVLIASSDATIALIRRHREQIEQRVRIALAEEPALAIAVSKERTWEVARRLGLQTPRTIRVGAVSEAGAALCEIGLPAVVKPVESWAWDGWQGTRLMVSVVTTLAEAESAVEELTRFGGSTLFQQFIPGRRESISLLYAQGQIYACYAQRHDHVSSGQSTLRQSIAVPQDIGDQAERLVREIGLEGCSEVEFRRDNAGNAYLMEVNPRLWASTELAVRSGVDFPYLLYQWACGEKIDMVKSYPVGGWLRHLRGDITVTVKALRQPGRPGEISPAKAVRDFCFAFFLPTGYDYFDWKDPLPAWRATTGCIRDLLQRVKKESSKEGIKS